MQLPPEKVPEDSTPEEYSRFAILYSLMDKHREAAEASARASAVLSGDKLSDVSSTEMQAGMALGGKLMELIIKALQNPEAESDDLLAEFVEEMRGLVPEDQLENLQPGLKEALNNARLESQPPPSDVPEGLSAEEFYKLGVKYKEVGWTEQARDALRAAIELDPSSSVGAKAGVYLRTKVPLRPVPMIAVQLNVQGYNQMAGGDNDGARQTFLELNRNYPDFEWPYGNLGSLLINEGELAEAEQILIQAVQLSPYYVNAWLHLARANILSSKFEQARYCINKVKEIDPDEEAAKEYERILQQVQSWS